MSSAQIIFFTLNDYFCPREAFLHAAAKYKLAKIKMCLWKIVSSCQIGNLVLILPASQSSG